MSDSDRVVPLRGRDGGGSRTPGGQRRSLLAEVRRIYGDRLGGLLRGMFDKVDDALFALAEKAESNAAQTQYFDAIREVRLRRQGMERTFRVALEQAVDTLDRGQSRDGGDRGRDSEDNGFQLIDNDELEETLAIKGMVGKTETQLKTTLDALTARLSVLLPDAVVAEDDRPLGPSAVCAAFRETAQVLQLDITAKLIIYKLFDKFVMSNLGEVYEAVNNVLIRGGVLPTLSPQTRRKVVRRPPPGAAGGATSPPTAARPQGSAYPDAPGPPQEPGYPGAPGEIPFGVAPGVVGTEQMAEGLGANVPELINILQQLVSANRGAPGGDYAAGGIGDSLAGGAESGAYFGTSDVLEALSNLQHTGARAPVALVDPRASMMALRSALAERAKSETGLAKALGATMEETIDVIEMLFDFILDDVNLPVPVKALIARLQIPVLKVALMDKSFVRKRKHPAWELINELARAGIGVNETEGSKRDAMFAMIERVVQRVLDEFEDDVSIFSTLLHDFREYLERERRRADAIEKRTREQEEGRAARDVARNKVSRAINERLSNRRVPSVLEQMLKSGWSRVLFLAYTKGGPEGPEWQKALSVVDQLMRGTQEQHTLAELNRLRETWPGLMHEVRNGLESVQYDPFETRKHLEALTQHVRESYSAQMERAKARTPAAAEEDATQRFDVAEAADEEGPTAVLPAQVLAEGEDELETTPELPSDNYSTMVENVAVGTWFEFQDQQGKQTRAKLSTKIPLTRTYIFVDRIGVKLAEWSFADLVEEVRAGRASILDDSALFDRVLSAAMNRLHS